MTPDKGHARTLTAARWLMLAYVAALPIVWPLDTRIFGIHILATDLIFAASFLCWSGSLLSYRPSFDKRYLGFAAVYFLALTLSSIFSTEPQKSFLKLTGVFYLIAVSIVIADFVFQNDSFFRRITYAWAVGSLVTILGTFVGISGFFLGYESPADNPFLFGFGSLPPGNYPRVKAFFENPNMTANFINIAIVIVLAGGRLACLWGRTSVVLGVMLFACAVAAISAGVGGLVLSVGLWISFVAFASRPKRRQIILLGSVAIALLAFISTTISPVSRETENSIRIPIIDKNIEPSVRLLVWQNALERSLENPIFGRGTGTDAAHLRYQVASGQNQLLRDAHQAWLNIFGQAGAVGLVAFLVLSFYLLSICRFGVAEASERSIMLAACSCAFAGAFFLQNLFGSFEDARHVWVLIGMMVGLAKPRN